MASYRIVLVGPKSEGNVGAVARAMANFDISELVLVNPPPLNDEAKERAMHAWDIVQGARTVPDFETAIRGADLVVGTSAKIPLSQKAHIRNPIDCAELPPKLAPMDGLIALCFGREDFGLLNEELEKCDLLVTIPTSARYKSLNLSHAVTVVLYELFKAKQTGPVKQLIPMSGEMKQTLEDHFDRLIDLLRMPPHKARNTKSVYRRLFGRAVPSAWEFFVFMGILSVVLRKYGVEVEGGPWDGEFEIPPELEASLGPLIENALKDAHA